MAKSPKFDTSFNFGANRQPRKARKGKKRGKGAAHGS
jgi:hypothetical protein